jgi:hypothetical protein
VANEQGLEIGDLHAEIERLGEREVSRIKKRLQARARRALADRPELDYDEVGPGTRAFLSAIDDMNRMATRAPKWSEDQFIAFVSKVSGLMVASEMMDAHVRQTAASFDCFDKCNEDLSRCFVRDGCDKSGWFCVCCTRCYTDYLDCKWDCVTNPGVWIELIKDQF